MDVNSSFWGDPTNLFITPSIDSIIADSSYNNSISEDNLLLTYTPSIGDKLYFLKGVNIPRVKMKNLIADFKIKTVRDITEATHIFGSRQSFDKMTNPLNFYQIPTSEFKLFFEGARNHMDIKHALTIDTALEFYNEPEILTNYYTNKLIQASDLPFNYTYNWDIVDNDDNYSKYSTKYFTVDEDVTDIFKHLQTSQVYDDSALLLHLNGDSAIEINEEVYQQLCEMFNSSDKDNHVLAMEIMANSNYTKSLLYLELLFLNYSHRIWDTKTKNHVNFKGLLSFLNKTNNSNTSIDIIVTNLRKHNQITKATLDRILKSESYTITRNNTTYFKTKSITVNEELLQDMNENYEFTVEDDYEVKEINIEAEELIEEEIIPETPIEIKTDESTDYFI